MMARIYWKCKNILLLMATCVIGFGLIYILQEIYYRIHVEDDISKSKRADIRMKSDQYGVPLQNTNTQSGNDSSHQQLLGGKMISANQYSPNCTVLLGPEPQVTLPFKIYIHQLPPEFNTDLVKCIYKQYPQNCFHPSYCGMGPQLYQDSSMSVRDTWQFSLEVIIHHKLLYSPYRTMDASKADIYYIPYYAAMACFCMTSRNLNFTADNSIKQLSKHLEQQPFFTSGKPMLSTVGKIEREHMTQRCRLLTNPIVKNIYHIGIEKDESESRRTYKYHRRDKPFIVAPYPSYGHLDITKPNLHYLQQPSSRNIRVLLAAAERRSNLFRVKILDQFAKPTRKSYKEYMRHASKKSIKNVWLSTSECQGRHKYYTIEWMKHSIFCLQPPGDSPTRKSFYDSILSGCIPVLFQKKKVDYPFSRYLNYSQFTVNINPDLVEKDNINVVQHLLQIKDDTIAEMQTYLKKFWHFFQYSYPLSNQPHNDAMYLILKDIAKVFNLKSSH